MYYWKHLNGIVWGSEGKKSKINKNLKLDFGSVKMGNENFFKFPLNVFILQAFPCLLTPSDVPDSDVYSRWVGSSHRRGSWKSLAVQMDKPVTQIWVSVMS